MDDLKGRKGDLRGAASAILLITAWILNQRYWVWAGQRASWLSIVGIFYQCWLNVGLFIMSHDSIHGTLLTGSPKLNFLLGHICFTLFAGFMNFNKFWTAHWKHHQKPGTLNDPDFYPPLVQNPSQQPPQQPTEQSPEGSQSPEHSSGRSTTSASSGASEVSQSNLESLKARKMLVGMSKERPSAQSWIAEANLVLRWYLNFMFTYYGFGEFLSQTLLGFIAVRLGGDPQRLLVYSALPSIMASFQLFYFGTYRVHRPDKNRPFADEHRALSNDFSWTLSLLTCFHFGYHHEHHLYPYVPWYSLPEAYQRRRVRQ